MGMNIFEAIVFYHGFHSFLPSSPTFSLIKPTVVVFKAIISSPYLTHFLATYSKKHKNWNEI